MACSRLLGDHLLELGEREEDAGFDRRNRSSQYACNLFVAQIVVHSQLENRLLLRREVPHELLYDIAPFSLKQSVMRRRTDASNTFVDFDKLPGVFLYVVQAMIDRNAIQPCFEPGIPRKAVSFSKALMKTS